MTNKWHFLWLYYIHGIISYLDFEQKGFLFFSWYVDIHTFFPLDLFLGFQNYNPGFYAFKSLENGRKYQWRFKKLDITRETNMFTHTQHPHLLPCLLPSPLVTYTSTHKCTSMHTKYESTLWQVYSIFFTYSCMMRPRLRGL